MKNFYKNKKILVTGGTGMIGIQLVIQLVNLGAKVSVASLEKNSSLPKNVKHHKIDLTHLNNCIKITKGIGRPVLPRAGPGTTKIPICGLCLGLGTHVNHRGILLFGNFNKYITRKWLGITA